MRKLFFMFILIFTVASLHFIEAKNVEKQYFKYTGCRINAYDKKDFDPSEGIIILDYNEKQVIIFTGAYKVLFSACPITYEYLSGNDNEKVVFLMNAYTKQKDECCLTFNFTNRYLLFNYSHDFSVIDFSFVFLNLELIETKYQEY